MLTPRDIFPSEIPAMRLRDLQGRKRWEHAAFVDSLVLINEPPDDRPAKRL
jgi:hypothetical protein